MTFAAFTALISSSADPVILVEGRRSIPEASAHAARRFSAQLATRFPHLRFRSGNATGTDEAFGAGVIAIAPERLQIVAPDAGHRKKQRHPLVSYYFPESLDPDTLETIKEMTTAATPANRGLVKMLSARRQAWSAGRLSHPGYPQSRRNHRPARPTRRRLILD